MQYGYERELLLDTENLRGPDHPSKIPGGASFKTILNTLTNEHGPTEQSDIPIMSISAPAINVSLLRTVSINKIQKNDKGVY